MIVERTKNTKRNITVGLINKLVHIILPFVLRTVIIKELGIEYLGINSLFTSVLSILSLAELGFDTSVVFIMYDGVAHNDNRKLKALLKLMKTVYQIVGGVIFVVGLFFIPFLNYLIKDASSIPSDINLYHIYVIFLLNTVISYFFGGYRNCLLKAYQREDVIANTQMCMYIAFFAIRIIILMLFKNYYWYIYTLPVNSILTNLLIVYYSKRMFPDIVPDGRVNKEETSQLKKLVAGSFIAKVGAMLTVTIDNIVVSAFLGITLLAYFSNYSYIVASLITVLYIIYSSMQGGLGNSLILDSPEKNYKDMQKLNFIYAWIIGWFMYCVCFLTQPFIRLWIGEEAVLPNYVVVLFGIYLYQAECIGIFGSYKAALGIVWEDRYRPLISGGFNIVVKIGLVLWLRQYSDEIALIGVLLATILSYGLINSPWATYLIFKNYFKSGFKENYLLTYKYFAIMLIVSLVSVPIFHLLPVVDGTIGYLNFLLRALLCIILPNFLLLIIYHKNKQFKEAKRFLLNRLK